MLSDIWGKITLIISPSMVIQADILCNHRGLACTTGGKLATSRDGASTANEGGGQSFLLFHLRWFSSQLHSYFIPIGLWLHVTQQKNIFTPKTKSYKMSHSKSNCIKSAKKKQKTLSQIVKWSSKHYPIKTNTISQLPTSNPVLQHTHTTVKVLQPFAGCVDLTKGWSFDSHGYWQKAAVEAAVGSNFLSRLWLHKATCPHMSKCI